MIAPFLPESSLGTRYLITWALGLSVAGVHLLPPGRSLTQVRVDMTGCIPVRGSRTGGSLVETVCEWSEQKYSRSPARVRRAGAWMISTCMPQTGFLA